MKFPYLFIKGILMPVIDVAINHDGRRLNTRALVDSGADSCVFDLEIAAALKIPYDRLNPTTLATAGGDITVYPGKMDIVLRRDLLHLRVFFAPKLPINLLGRDNFFKYYLIQFDELRHEMRLTRQPKRK